MWRKGVRMFFMGMIACGLMIFYNPVCASAQEKKVFVGSVVFPSGACGIRFCAITDPCRMYIVPISVGYDARAFIVIIAGDVNVFDGGMIQYAAHTQSLDIGRETARKTYPLAEIISLLCGGIGMFVLSTVYLRRRNEFIE